MRKALIATAAIAAAVVFFLLATMPPAPRVASGEPEAELAGRLVSGAYHVHTSRSDGGATREEIAEAAARAGLQFVVFTDHGNGTEPGEPPAYLHGVLCVEGVEISTNGGHYVAIDMPTSPYPLGGEPDTVVEDVQRLGGFGVAAHPLSGKPALRWADWASPIDGIEWMNADSEWRDERIATIVRVPFDYLIRPAGALASILDRPVDVLGRFDALAATRPIVALAAHDAHGGVSARAEDGQQFGRLGIPSYEASFRSFRITARLTTPLRGDAVPDARELYGALREGRVFTAIGAVAWPAWMEFRGRQAQRDVRMGQALTPGVPATFTLRGPRVDGATTVLVCNGTDVDAAETDLEAEFTGEGACRAEIRVPGAPGTPPVPWILGNPIYLHAEPATVPAPPAIAEIVRSIDPAGLRVEKDPASIAALAGEGRTRELSFKLAEGARASQYVALASPLTRDAASFDRVLLTAHASRPMRLSVQLRFDADGGSRWGASVYVSTEPSRLSLSLDRLRPLDGGGEPPRDWSAAAGLLLVVDLTNAEPGFERRLTVSDLALAQGTR
jgi:hypothetical protein